MASFQHLWIASACVVASLAAVAAGQQPPGNPPQQPGPFRALAPGVMHTVSPAMQKGESNSYHDLIGLLDRDPRFVERPHSKNLAKGVRLSHDIWGLHFSFKPMRIIDVDVPRSGGKFDRKKIWYLLFRIENKGDKPVKFIPRIFLISDQYRLVEAERMPKVYPDRLIPVAVGPIRRREDPQRKLLNMVEISANEIEPSTPEVDNSVWGVATWEYVDPKTDAFSVYIQGLTNAYKIEPVKDKNGKPAWRFLRKTLKINFWRPGDEFLETDREIRLGAPNEVAFEWLYK